MLNSTSMRILLLISLFAATLAVSQVHAASVAYIHGRVADNGEILEEGEGNAFDPMLLDDTGNKGISEFRDLVRAQGHTITAFRDKDTLLNDGFLDNYDAIVFGLHQKIWSGAEKAALDSWLRAGGGMFIYSDSASGGSFRIVGAQNNVGQMVTNNLIAQYGMQVTVDQADGTFDFPAVSMQSNVLLPGQRIEGEGVSPVAVSSNPDIEILVPFTRSPRFEQGITISNPSYAALALRRLDQGHVAVMFDRQPMWNNGPGSDIEEQDNKEILRRVINFLAERPSLPPPVPPKPRNSINTIVPAILFLIGDG